MIFVLDAVMLAILLGLVTGGRISALSRIKLHFETLLLLSLLAQLLLPVLVPQGVLKDSIAVFLLWGVPSLGLLVALLANWRQPGLVIAVVGVTLNLVVVLLNHGMPVSVEAGAAVAFNVDSMQTALTHSWLHVPADASSMFLVLGDVLPIPGPSWHRGMASLGDIMLAAGVAYLVFSSMHELDSTREIQLPDER